jgi:hypothetical protein
MPILDYQVECKIRTPSKIQNPKSNMARIFYAILLSITAALGSIVWARHGLPNLWTHLFGVRSAQAQTTVEANRFSGNDDSPGSPPAPSQSTPHPSQLPDGSPAERPRWTRGYLARRAKASPPSPAARGDGRPLAGPGHSRWRADETPPAEENEHDDAATQTASRTPARRPDHFRPTSKVTGPDFVSQKIDLDDPTNPSAPEGPSGDAVMPPAEESLRREFENTKVLAKVGSDVILAGDVLPTAIEVFNEKKKSCPPEQYEKMFQEAVISQVMSLVKIKLLYVQARRKIPDDKLPDLQKRIEQDFEEKAVPTFMKNEQCKSRRELEDKLRETGNSIERVRRNFVETQIAQQWFRDQVKEDGIKATHDDLLARYRENLAKYEHPATARYEELVVKLSKYGSQAEARAALAEMGNMVYRGASFADVAKARSDGSTAAEGGLQEITQDSHVSRVIDEAIFSLPVGAMSEILEDLDPKLKDKRCYHIIRVVERKPAWTTPFTDVQTELAEEIKNERMRGKQTEYMQKIFAETPPWTVFDRANTVKQPPPPTDRYQR